MKRRNGIRYLTVFAAVLFLSSCGVMQDTSGSEVTSEETASVETAAPTEAPTSTPTPTPAPTSTPTPTPVPTPVPEYVEAQFEETWINGYVDPRSVSAQIITNAGDYDALVNKYYACPEDYEPDDLVDAPHSMDQQVRAEVCEAWEAMYDACLEETGCELFLMSGYRSYSLQTYLFQRQLGRGGITVAVMKNAYQGRSEHQLGLAIDLTQPGDTELSDSFDETVPGAWVNDHCYEYGFIRRYTEDITDITGYADEAWHYRYVGIELATYLYENHMSLEEYWGVCQVLPGDE